MGKGDRKSKKGKIWRGTFGVSRPRAKDTPYNLKDNKEAAEKPAAKKPKKKTATKAKATTKTKAAKTTKEKAKKEKAESTEKKT